MDFGYYHPSNYINQSIFTESKNNISAKKNLWDLFVKSVKKFLIFDKSAFLLHNTPKDNFLVCKNLTSELSYDFL